MTLYLMMALILAAVTATLPWQTQSRDSAVINRQVLFVYRSPLVELEQNITLGKFSKGEGDRLCAEIARRRTADANSLIAPVIAIPCRNATSQNLKNCPQSMLWQQN
jgi:predicted RNase H-like nuclease